MMKCQGYAIFDIIYMDIKDLRFEEKDNYDLKKKKPKLENYFEHLCSNVQI